MLHRLFSALDCFSVLALSPQLVASSMTSKTRKMKNCKWTFQYFSLKVICIVSVHISLISFSATALLNSKGAELSSSGCQQEEKNMYY